MKYLTIRSLVPYLAIILLISFSSCKRDKYGKYTEDIDYSYLIPDEEIDPEEAKTWIQTLTDSVMSPSYFPNQTHREFLHVQLQRFYRDNNYQPVWYSATEVLPHTASLVGHLKGADVQGLHKNAYALRQIDEIQNALLGSDGEFDLPKLMKLDVFTTAMALTYINHVHRGRIQPKDLEDKEVKKEGLNLWVEDVKPVVAVDALKGIVKGNDINQAIQAFEPRYELYPKLKKAYQGYQQIVSEGGWEELPLDGIDYKIKIDTNQRHELIPTIRNILSKTGDFQGEVNDTSQLYNLSLREALVNYQNRHTLEPDGVIGMRVLKEMAHSAEDRLEQIALNMERMRWLTDSLGDNYFIVNVPAFWVRLYDKGKRNFESKVMVGQTFHPTPLFKDKMEYIVLSPKWHVPNSISTNEMLPILKRNPSYFKRNNYKIYRGGVAINPYSINWSGISNMAGYSVVQESGPGNALGRVKFIFPNSNNVYLHDTPSTRFGEANRALSHGCIRLEKPEELANYLLSQNSGDWNEVKVHDAMFSGKTQHVNLDRKWDVHIVYWTTWVDDEGKVHFSKDVYEYDKKQKEILAKKDSELEDWMEERSQEFEILKEQSEEEIVLLENK